MVEKLITLWQEKVILYNINHPRYTDKIKRKAVAEKTQLGFEGPRLVNPLSVWKKSITYAFTM